MPLRLLFLLVVCSLQARAQFSDRYWTFGDSAAIDFRNISNPVPGESVLRARGNCASICDSSGNLLFYAGAPYVPYWLSGATIKQGYVVNSSHQMMENGDTIVGTTFYQEMVIVPNPGNSNQFYLFTCEIIPSAEQGFYWNLIDLSYNGGLGKVIQKNVQLQNFPVNDGLAAVKHGNGRDWWVVHTRWEATIGHNEYFIYLVTSDGVFPQPVQNIGDLLIEGFLRLKFSQNGELLVATGSNHTIDLYDFNRCTGLLSNYRQILLRTEPTLEYLTWSSEFSPDNNRLYTTSIPYGNNDTLSCLLQFDLTALDIRSTLDTIQTFLDPFICGFVKLGPDSQIYLSHFTDLNDCDFFYLYCDTTYYPEIMNLSVIHQPNELGALCDFRPYNFYLGGHRSYHGLPNNPNYELGPLAGSVCDTLITSVSQVPVFEPAQLKLFFHTGWRQLFVNGQQLKGKQGSLALYSVTGQLLRREEFSIQPPYYTRQWDLTGTAAGLYIVVLETEKERVSGRVVVE